MPGDLQVVCRRQRRARMNSVTPPHRVTSSCRQSTAPASSSRAESASDQLYSPAATSGRTCCRTVARPVAAVGVHVELGIRADHLAGELGARQVPALVPAPRLADLDLDPGDALLVHPLAELLPGARVVVAGEAAAAVYGYVLTGQAEQAGQRLAQQPGLEVPQGDINRGD